LIETTVLASWFDILRQKDKSQNLGAGQYFLGEGSQQDKTSAIVSQHDSRDGRQSS
jgi:hypothetical protein